MIVRLLNKIIKPFQYTLKRIIPPDEIKDIFEDKDFLNIYSAVKSYTMTSAERIFSLYQSVQYVVKNNIQGDFVECGVWRGGSAMVIAMTLNNLGVSNRRIYMYDTFEGMSEPTDKDKDIYGKTAGSLLDKNRKVNNENNVWCYSALEEVRTNLLKTNYPVNQLFFIKGKVEDTIPGTMPSSIALLRLDTDWYESTLHELNHLYPLLVSKGILIIDDYGHWQGARKAVDTYISDNNLHLFLSRIDYTGRLAIKN